MRRADEEIRIGASYPGGCSRDIALEPAAVQLGLHRQAIMRSLSPVQLLCRFWGLAGEASQCLGVCIQVLGILVEVEAKGILFQRSRAQGPNKGQILDGLPVIPG